MAWHGKAHSISFVGGTHITDEHTNGWRERWTAKKQKDRLQRRMCASHPSCCFFGLVGITCPCDGRVLLRHVSPLYCVSECPVLVCVGLLCVSRDI